MSLGERLVEALKGSSEPREVEASEGGVVARATVSGADRYGCAVDHLSVSAPGRAPEDPGTEVRRQAEAVRDRVRYLPEPVEPIEVEPSLGEAILRTPPEEIRQGRYFEARLRGGREIEVQRFRADRQRSERECIPAPFTHETLERLADDLGEIVQGR
jgi:hypothetical protein